MTSAGRRRADLAKNELDPVLARFESYPAYEDAFPLAGGSLAATPGDDNDAEDSNPRGGDDDADPAEQVNK